MGLKTLVLYITTTLFAITVGLVLVNIIQPGQTFPQEKQIEYQEKFGANIIDKQTAAEEIRDQSPLNFIVDMVPENIFNASADNSKMLQIILFAVLFAISMILIPGKKMKPVKDFIDSLNDIILKLIDIIMLSAPYGVFALLAALVVDFAGDTDLFAALGLYFPYCCSGSILTYLLFSTLFSLKYLVERLRLINFSRPLCLHRWLHFQPVQAQQPYQLP